MNSSEYNSKLIESVISLLDKMESCGNDEDSKIEAYDHWSTVCATMSFLIEMYLREDDSDSRTDIVNKIHSQANDVIAAMESLDKTEFFKSFMYKGKKVEA